MPDPWAHHIPWGLLDNAVLGTHGLRVLPWDLLWDHRVLDLNPQAVRNVLSHQMVWAESPVRQDPATCSRSIDPILNENRCPAKPIRR